MSEPDYHQINDAITELDEQIEALQQAKRGIIQQVRDEHGKKVADQVKLAVKLNRMDGAKRMERDEIEDGAFRILSILQQPRAPRATRTRENIEQFGAELPAHDADGVIIEDQPETATKSEGVTHDLDNAYAGTASDENPAPNSHSTPSYPEVVEQAGAVSSSAAAPVPNSHSSEPNSSQAETKTAGEVTPPTSPAPYSDADVPAFIRAPVNERCLKQGACQFARHPHKITCSDCGSAFIKKRAEARP